MMHRFDPRLGTPHPATALVLGALAAPAAAAGALFGLGVGPAIVAGALAAGLAGVWHIRRLTADRARTISDAETLRRELDDAQQALRTREALLDQEREAHRAKDALLSAMSHDLRAPLQGITAWTQLLSASQDDPACSRGLAAIARNAQNLGRVLAELADVSNVVTGTTDLTFDLVDLRTPIRAAIDSVRSPAHAKYIVLDVHLPEEPCYITGDRDRLQRVMSTLLSNAVRSTQTGGVISVMVAREGADYRVDVADTGIGIASDVARPFERCQPFDVAAAREHTGVNLWLAIVKELAERHGGSVDASSACLDDASAIAIRLPALTDVRWPDACGPPPPSPRSTA
ncbi:MAG: HAMP domain-containing histidine kinase [Acidobacteria bacterium]|nr:HAMP domain-containing histidine kinase [Acidobacteriota bacterium]